jgi:hypothetical protein
MKNLTKDFPITTGVIRMTGVDTAYRQNVVVLNIFLMLPSGIVLVNPLIDLGCEFHWSQTTIDLTAI